MRIAFVGKGGSGKTTLAALFTLHINEKYPVLTVDADINVHLGPLLGFEKEIPAEKHISHPKAAEAIRKHLTGNNRRIKDPAHFRKTTPPSAESRFVFLDNPEDPILAGFGAGNGKLRLMVVGTYDSEEIGASCYHNNLAIFENVLSHLVDSKGVVVADMVAGVDAFANTLHAQFDMLVLTVEPTRRSVEVFEQYKGFAESAGVYGLLYAVGNKVRSESDAEFIEKNIPKGKLIGFFGESEYLRRKDREGGPLDVGLLEEKNRGLLRAIEKKLLSVKPDYKSRLEKLFDLHRKYVAQPFIAERFGDLTGQIDPDFDINLFVQNHGNGKE
jgi:CO dehydrogenase maturation factor